MIFVAVSDTMILTKVPIRNRRISYTMKKIFAVSLVLLIVLAGCFRKTPQSAAPDSDSSEPAAVPSASEPEPPKSKASTPEGAVEELFESIKNMDYDQINELVGQYFENQTLPEEYFLLLKPITERVSYKIGESRIDGDNAMVDISVTAVDAQKAVNSVMPGAVAHLAAMQLTGKDISNPEKIIAEYAADNIKWDSLPTIKTDTTLYLVMGADGDWKVDVSNPDNIDFVNAVSGGAIEVAKDLKSFAERYK